MISRSFRSIVLLAACLALVLTAPLHAGEVKYPPTGSGITMTVPDAWGISKKNGNFLLTDPKGRVSLTLSTAIGEGSETPEEGAKEFSEGAGLKDIQVKKGPDSEEGGNTVSVAVALGKMKGKDYVTTVMKLTMADGTKMAIIAFGEKAAVLDNKELDAIMNSMK